MFWGDASDRKETKKSVYYYQFLLKKAHSGIKDARGKKERTQEEVGRKTKRRGWGEERVCQEAKRQRKVLEREWKGLRR